jgi:hypothetical protein
MGRKECKWAILKRHELPCFRYALARTRRQNGLRDSAFLGQPQVSKWITGNNSVRHYENIPSIPR